jgi:hypothetical protein
VKGIPFLFVGVRASQFFVMSAKLELIGNLKNFCELNKKLSNNNRLFPQNFVKIPPKIEQL